MSALVPASRHLRPYQKTGVSWMARRLTQHGERVILLCDDPGLGKSRQILELMDLLDVGGTVIVAPAGARSVWAHEIQRWFPRWVKRLLLIEPGVTRPMARHMLAKPDTIVVLGYDALGHANTGWRTALGARRWDLLVCDEAHYLKNASARTEALYGTSGSNAGLQAQCDRVILATGTPTPNHAGELYQHIRTFWPGLITVQRAEGREHLETLGEFEERFCIYKETPWGRQIIGSRQQELLRQKLGHLVMRRRKLDVLPELEPLIAQDVALNNVHAVDRDIIVNSTAAGRLLTQQVQSVVDSAYLTRESEVLAVLKSGEEIGPIATVRRQLGEMKIRATVEWVAERLSCGIGKMLLFGWHVHALHRVHDQLAQFDPVIITGETTPAGRRKAEDLFQHHSRVRVLVGQMLACGTALTLTAANEVAIMEPSWVPAQNSQAIDRAHRLGQHSSVLASFLYVPGTVDEHIMKTFRRKAEEVAQLVRHQTEREHV